MSPRNAGETKSKLLAAARDVIRAKGYTATTVDDICAAAGVTKGGFFHHFAVSTPETKCIGTPE